VVSVTLRLAWDRAGSGEPLLTFLGAMLLLAVLVNLYVKNYASTRR
jgi:hypothetical protein